jgi:transposase
MKKSRFTEAQIIGMRNHPPTLAYGSKRKKDSKRNREIIRCLKRYIVREFFAHLSRPDASLAVA